MRSNTLAILGSWLLVCGSVPAQKASYSTFGRGCLGACDLAKTCVPSLTFTGLPRIGGGFRSRCLGA